MGRMIALKCPNCDAPLEVDEDRERFFCRFCGSPVLLSRRTAEGIGDTATDAVGRQSAGSRSRVAIPERLQIEDSGGTLTLTYRWFTWGVLFLIPFCIAWNAFLIGWYSMAAGFDGGMPGPMKWIFLIFPLGHVAVGLGLAYAVVTALCNRTRIRIGNGSLSVHHGPIYFPGSQTLSVDDIEQLYCERNLSTKPGHNVSGKHVLKARLKNGRAVTLLSGTMDADMARAIEQLVEDHLRIEDDPSAGKYDH